MNAVLNTWFPLAVTFCVACLAAITDVIQFRVRNVVTFPLIVSGLVYHAVLGGWSGLAAGGLGLGVGLGLLIVPWLLGLMGAGDVKLLGGVGAWLGMPAVVSAFLVAAAVTFVYAVIQMARRGKLRESLVTMKVIFYRFLVLGAHFGKEDLVEECFAAPDRRLRVIPFGAMVPLGIIGTVVWFVWFK